MTNRVTRELHIDERRLRGEQAPVPPAGMLIIPATDIDRQFERAVKAGAEVLTPVQKMFWGDR